MPRPKHIDTHIKRPIQVPEELSTQVDMLLYSELEAKVPYGAWSKYVVGLIRDDLELRAQRGAGR